MPWYNNSWLYRREITIDNTSGAAQTDFPVQVDLTALDFTFANAKSDGSDLRFTSSDETTLIPHWIQDYDDTGETATIWVKVPSVGAAASATIYLYYGNAAATDTSSGDDVFTFFDDFATALDEATPTFAKALIGNYTQYASNPIVATTGATFYSNEVREQSQIFKVGSTYHLLFTGYNGTVYTVGLATSTSPTAAWTVQGARIDDAEDPYVAINTDGTPYFDGTYYYVFFERRGGGDTSIGCGRTTDFASFEVWDGATWTSTTANHAAIIPLGPGGSYDASGCDSPTVVHDGTEYTMLYEARGGSGDTTAVARASSPTGTWTKYASNPIATLDVPDDVRKYGSTWVLTGHTTAGGQQLWTTTDEPGAWDQNSFSALRVDFAGYNSSIMFVEDFPTLACFIKPDSTRSDVFDWVGSTKWEAASFQQASTGRAYQTGQILSSAGTTTMRGTNGTASDCVALVTSGVALTDDFEIMCRYKVVDQGTNKTKFLGLGFGSGTLTPTGVFPKYANGFIGQIDTSTFILRKYTAGSASTEASGSYTEAEIEAFNIHRFSYLSSGALSYAIGASVKASGTDADYIGNSKDLIVSQGQNTSTQGGLGTFDWLAVRTYDGTDPDGVAVGAEQNAPATTGNRMGGTGAIRQSPRRATRPPH